MSISKNLKKTVMISASALMMLGIGGGAVNAMHSNVHASSYSNAESSFFNDNSIPASTKRDEEEEAQNAVKDTQAHPEDASVNAENQTNNPYFHNKNGHQYSTMDPNNPVVPDDTNIADNTSNNANKPASNNNAQPKRHNPVQPKHHDNKITPAKHTNVTPKRHKARKHKAETLTDKINRLTRELNKLEDQNSRINGNTRKSRQIRKHANKVARHAGRLIRQHYLD